jgi:integrase/recombinase XerD
VLARLAHGVADGTIRGEIGAVEQFLEHAGVFAWEVEPAHADRFLGRAQRHQAVGTRRGRAKAVDLFFRFLEARYRGEICELTGRVVVSPVDDCSRPRRSGDFQVRVPPSPVALTAFFASWRGELPAARKWLAAARHYAMARLAGEAGLRLRELCWLRLADLHFGHGPLGKIHVRMGKGSRGSGPRERLVPMLGDARPLLVWWVTGVRGQFTDDWELPLAVVFPSERGGPIGGDTFAAALNQAAAARLHGPVTKLTPHVLRHACASRPYGEGIGLAAVRQLPGHRWLSTTVRYVHVAGEAIESACQQAAERAAARFKEQRHAVEPAAGRRPARHLAVLRPAAAAGRGGPGDLGRENVAPVVGAADLGPPRRPGHHLRRARLRAR